MKAACLLAWQASSKLRPIYLVACHPGLCTLCSNCDLFCGTCRQECTAEPIDKQVVLNLLVEGIQQPLAC